MHYFIDNIKTYASVNKRGRELQIFVQQFDRHLIADECSLDALKCEIEHQIKVMNEKYPRSRPVLLKVFDNGKAGQWTILVENDSDSIVCIISYEKVLGYYTLAEKVDEFTKKGVCRICGCTDDDPCFNPRVGNCWWIDETHTLCSHCADEELSCCPETRHCINSTFESDKYKK